VIGISHLQTGPDLIEAEVFSETPTTTPVQGRTDEETAALSYFLGNCITCHNGGDSINSSFSLYPEDAVANTVDQPTESETGEGIRVVPGDPVQSVLYITVVEAGATGYRGPFKVMPPIGGNIIDPDASAILGAWIENL
jgi:mono/diheme cytochrome c family protein